jgi:hypothetical protein
MGTIQDLLSFATTLLVLGLIIGGVMKLFQIATDMQEMKEILKDIRRGGGLPSPAATLPPPLPAAQPGPVSPGLASLASAMPADPASLPANRPPTPEELVRAVHSQDFRGDDFPL